jgi:uncharacterized protein with gpF-like domain
MASVGRRGKRRDKKTPPFDRALELHDLDEAADEFASRHGEHGSADYREAWLRFRARVHTAEDLRRLRLAARERAAKTARDRGEEADVPKPASTAPARDAAG